MRGWIGCFETSVNINLRYVTSQKSENLIFIYLFIIYSARSSTYQKTLLQETKNGYRKQRKDIGKYSFVNRTIKNWNQLPAEELGAFPCKLKNFRQKVRKAIINRVK